MHASRSESQRGKRPLIRIAIVAAAVLAAAAGGSQPTHATVPAAEPVPVLVSTDWLAAHADRPDLVLLLVGMAHRGMPQTLIPGSGFLDYHAVASQQRDGLIIEIPEVESLVEVFRQAGVSNDSHVVLYGAPGHLPARVFMTLDYLGHERVSVLDGGLEVWRQGGGEIVTQPAPLAPGDFTAQPRDDVLVSADWVNEHLDDASVTLIDARPRNEFTGDRAPRNGRGGHIPGAANLYWEDLLESEQLPRLQDIETARGRFEAAGAREDGLVVSYCYIGMRASYTYLISKHLGYPARFYDGSWDEWSQRADLPVATGQRPPL